MHDCKTTMERLTEFVLDGASETLPGALNVELRKCEVCRAEFNALRDSLRPVTRALEMAAPPDSYWPVYHARLKEKLAVTAGSARENGSNGRRQTLLGFVSGLFSSSVVVRTPVVVASVVLFVVSIAAVVWSLRSSGPAIASPLPPSIVHVPVEVPVQVPVIREKVVTRTVYLRKERRTSVNSAAAAPKLNQASLMGFKPAADVKLTVIKGGLQDEN